jgi:hypothetical protein
MKNKKQIMKSSYTNVSFAAAFTTLSAQTEMKKIVTNNDYNKWSIEWLVVLTNHKDP